MHHQGQQTTFEERIVDQRTRQHGNERRHDWSLPGLLRVDGAQMATHGSAARTGWLGHPHGTAGDRRVEQRPGGASDRGVAEPAAGPSRLGAKNALLAVLRSEPAWQGRRALPSHSRVAADLAQARLACRYQRHVALPQPSTSPPSEVHEEWQMDAQGVVQVKGIGQVSVINLLDRVSRLKV